MFNLVIFVIFLPLAKIVTSQHNICGGVYEKMSFDEFLESASFEKYTLYPYTGNFELKISFCVEKQDGLIASASDSKHQFFLILEIKNHVVLAETYISHESTPNCLWSLGSVITDGQKHTLSLTLHPKNKLLESVLLTQSSVSKTEINMTNCAPSTIAEFQHLEIGAEVSTSGKGIRPVFQKSFIGCMNIRVNGKPLNQVARRINSTAIHECSTFQAQCQEDCPEQFQSKGNNCICSSTSKLNLVEEQCEPSCDCIKCHNGGTCKVIGEIWSCQCPKYYKGDYCDIDPCDKLSCQNGGFCKLHDDGHTQCHCTKLYTGELCEIVIDPCEKSPCQNSGTCSQNFTTDSGYQCKCLENYEGLECEKKMDTGQNFLSSPGFASVIAFSVIVVLVLVLVPIIQKYKKYRMERVQNQRNENEPTPNIEGKPQNSANNAMNGLHL